tara:strand:+ start:409 stop:519 length:111 start_codon:yes stop_codon:yes gene_type:complete
VDNPPIIEAIKVTERKDIKVKNLFLNMLVIYTIKYE